MEYSLKYGKTGEEETEKSTAGGDMGFYNFDFFTLYHLEAYKEFLWEVG